MSIKRILVTLNTIGLVWIVVSLVLIMCNKLFPKKTKDFHEKIIKNYSFRPEKWPIRHFEAEFGSLPPIKKFNCDCAVKKSTFCDNGVPFTENDQIYAETIDHGNWKQINVQLPPFHWETPRLLNNETAKMFWIQPENVNSFSGPASSTRGTVRVIKNGTFSGNFLPKKDSNFINFKNEPQFTENPKYDIAFYLSGHQTEYFQHFIDIGFPHIVLMLLATGYDPKDVVLVLGGLKPEIIKNILRVWGFKDVVISSRVSAKVLVLPENVPSIHPKFYEFVVQKLNLQHKEDKIVFVSRKRTDTNKPFRIIMNQDEIIRKLKFIYGNRVVLYVPKKSTPESTIKMFQNAAVVIGIHGGAMYNAIFSSNRTKIVEIMPVFKSGLYFRQRDPSQTPLFAHTAIYSNSQALTQPFYRYYAVGQETKLFIDVDDFTAFVESVVDDEI